MSFHKKLKKNSPKEIYSEKLRINRFDYYCVSHNVIICIKKKLEFLNLYKVHNVKYDARLFFYF